MTTLAQMLLDNPLVPEAPDNGPAFVELAAHVLRRIAVPGKAYRVGTGGMIEVSPKDARLSAERFVFAESDPIDAVMEQVRGGFIDMQTVRRFTELPANPIWLEYRENDPDDRHGRVGHLVQRLEGDELAQSPQFPMAITSVISAAPGEKPGGCLFLSVRLPEFTDPRLNNDEGFPAEIDWLPKAWWKKTFGVKSTTAMAREVSNIARDVACMLFLLNVPRVCEMRDHKPSDKLQRARTRSGKSPLIEFRQVKLVVGLGSPRYKQAQGSRAVSNSATDEAYAHKRLHRVIGHFRIYHERHDKGLPPSWVPEHWRGDASRGVILKNRNVEIPQKGKPT